MLEKTWTSGTDQGKIIWIDASLLLAANKWAGSTEFALECTSVVILSGEARSISG